MVQAVQQELQGAREGLMAIGEEWSMELALSLYRGLRSVNSDKKSRGGYPRKKSKTESLETLASETPIDQINGVIFNAIRLLKVQVIGLNKAIRSGSKRFQKSGQVEQVHSLFRALETVLTRITDHQRVNYIRAYMGPVRDLLQMYNETTATTAKAKLAKVESSALEASA